MDSQLGEILKSSNGFRPDDDEFFNSSGQPQYTVNGFHHDLELKSLDLSFLQASPDPYMFPPSSTLSNETESPDDRDSDEVLKFLNMILVEENMEERPTMFQDPIALQATERSLYELIGQEYPPMHNPDVYLNLQSDSPESIIANSSDYVSSSNDGSSSVEPQWLVDPGEFNSKLEDVQQQGFTSNSYLQGNLQTSFPLLNHPQVHSNPDTFNSLDNADLVKNFFSSQESILQFKKGMEEASKFLPTNNQVIIDLEQYQLPQKSQNVIPVAAVKVESDDIQESANPMRRRKYDFSENENSENLERSSKQSAVHVDEDDLSEYFDRVLLCSDANSSECGFGNKLPSSEKTAVQVVQANGSNVKSSTKKSDGDGDTVDLLTLLISCAQAVASDDRRTAYEQLKQIDLHSSPTGSASQRVAHVFASGLQARLGGTGNQLCAAFTHRKMTAFEKLKAFQVFLCACPFKRLPLFFANRSIGLAALAAPGAHTLHIVDFGILYGFQWPALIQCLSLLPGPTPKLRITGIDHPQPGFRPEERIEETGRRLARYCERFHVPFEYHAIATQNWESIKLEELKIERDEVLAVNCLFRLGTLLDETVVVDSPRDKLLRLIRKMKPDIYVSGVTNGSYSSPFFVTRFKEALFHYSALFDIFETTIAHDSSERIDFEQDFLGREVMNVVACEGADRTERPETYKQWHARHLRAGFKPMPTNQEIIKKLKAKNQSHYHKDFLFDEDGTWMLQGWKGRIMCATSCWVPS